MADSILESIEVSRLRVGMFVQIDANTSMHPFPLGGFLIENETQLVQLQALGLDQVCYSPERSKVPPLPISSTGVTWATLGVPLHFDSVNHELELENVQSTNKVEPIFEGQASGLSAETPESKHLTLAKRRALLAQQQASLDRCEQQYCETSRQLRHVFQSARSNPKQARQIAVVQIETMLGQVNGCEEIAIRLLSEKAGQETGLHAMNVSVLSILLGRVLGFDATQLSHLGLGALLHDIGKLELPDRLYWWDDHSTAIERRLFQSHVAKGVALAKKMGLPVPVIEVIAQHHEHHDGGGYPAGLKGDQIRPLTRVVALVNQYDNLCNPGNPAHALTPHDALALIFARQRDAFDSAVLAAFIRMMGVYPPGSVLQLNDDRYAIVVSVNSERPLKPCILIHEPEIPIEEALLLDLECHSGIGIQRAVKPIQLPRAVFDYLSPRKRICYFFERSATTSRSEPT